MQSLNIECQICRVPPSSCSPTLSFYILWLQAASQGSAKYPPPGCYVPDLLLPSQDPEPCLGWKWPCPSPPGSTLKGRCVSNQGPPGHHLEPTSTADSQAPPLSFKSEALAGGLVAGRFRCPLADSDACPLVREPPAAAGERVPGFERASL